VAPISRRPRRLQHQYPTFANQDRHHDEYHEGYGPTEYYPVKREKARQKFEPRFQADPDFRALADAYAEYLARRR
jgi:acyl-CoA dehydrogenase